MEQVPDDLISEIMQYTSVLPTTRRVSRAFERITTAPEHQANIRRVLNTRYPRWDSNNAPAIRYSVGRMILNRDWDQLLFTMKFHEDNPDIISSIVKTVNDSETSIPERILNTIYDRYSDLGAIPVVHNEGRIASILSPLDRNTDALIKMALRNGNPIARALMEHDDSAYYSRWVLYAAKYGPPEAMEIFFRGNFPDYSDNLMDARTEGTLGDPQNAGGMLPAVAMVAGTLDPNAQIPRDEMDLEIFSVLQDYNLPEEYLTLIDNTQSDPWKYLLGIMPGNKEDAILAIGIIAEYATPTNIADSILHIRDIVSRYNIDHIDLPMEVQPYILPHIVRAIPSTRNQVPDILRYALSHHMPVLAISAMNVLDINREQVLPMLEAMDPDRQEDARALLTHITRGE